MSDILNFAVGRVLKREKNSTFEEACI